MRRWIALVLVAGCAAPQQPAEKKEAPPSKKEETSKVDPIQAQDEEARLRLEEALKGRPLLEQEDTAESDRLLELAQDQYDRADFDRAATFARLSLRKNRENRRARELLEQILAKMTGGEPPSGAVRDITVKIEQAIVEILTLIRTGERYYNALMFEDAVREFEQADFQIRHVPYEVPQLKEIAPLVAKQLKKARDARTREEERVRDEKRKAADREFEAHEVSLRREVTEKIAYLLELAYMAFDQKKFEQCVKLCREILLIDPHYTVGHELIADCNKARHREEYFKFIQKKIGQWKTLTATDDEAVIPYSETVRFPSIQEWREISKRIEKSVLSNEEERTAEDADILAIRGALEKTKIDMNFEGAKLEDILAFIRDFTNLNILIDDGVRESVDLEKPVSFKVKELVLKNVFKLLLSQFGLDYEINEARVVWITTPDKLGGKAVVELHDIRDLLVKIADFPGPSVELTTPSSSGGALTGATFTLEEPKETGVGQDQIVELIKENIKPGTWEGEYTIELTPNQQLLVNHTTDAQREVREFLARLRSYTGTMVSVTARFVAAFDDFLDDVGVDIINRPAAAGTDFPGVGLTDIDEFADFPAGFPGSEVGAGFLTFESARQEAYELRGQTFHTMLQFDPLTGVGIDPLSNRLTNQGGLGMQYQWLGEQQLQTVMRALHKQQKATIVQAPRITVFNTQRSHIMALTQIAYVQDLDPQIATLAAAYDPVIGTLTQGVVLDVRPVVSNDRKYVTLELRPSLAELQLLRTININTGLPAAGGTVIQLPWIVLQKAEATVSVPDRGTIMVSGFKDLRMHDLHSGVPGIEHIPVLNFFATRKGKSDERRRLLILVTPEIIDLGEREDEQY